METKDPSRSIKLVTQQVAFNLGRHTTGNDDSYFATKIIVILDFTNDHYFSNYNVILNLSLLVQVLLNSWLPHWMCTTRIWKNKYIFFSIIHIYVTKHYYAYIIGGGVQGHEHFLIYVVQNSLWIDSNS